MKIGSLRVIRRGTTQIPLIKGIKCHIELLYYCNALVHYNTVRQPVKSIKNRDKTVKVILTKILLKRSTRSRHAKGQNPVMKC